MTTRARAILNEFNDHTVKKQSLWCVCRWSQLVEADKLHFCGPLGFPTSHPEYPCDRSLRNAFFPDGKISPDLFLTETQEEAERAIIETQNQIGVLRPVPISALDWGVTVYSHYDGSTESISCADLDSTLMTYSALLGIAAAQGDDVVVRISCGLRRVDVT